MNILIKNTDKFETAKYISIAIYTMQDYTHSVHEQLLRIAKYYINIDFYVHVIDVLKKLFRAKTENIFAIINFYRQDKEDTEEYSYFTRCFEKKYMLKSSLDTMQKIIIEYKTEELIEIRKNKFQTLNKKNKKSK